MAKYLAKLVAGTTFLLILGASQIHAAALTLTVDVPKTAYIQWLATAGATMTSVDGDITEAFAAYTGGAMTQLAQPANKSVYIGLMSNSLAGYDLTLTGANTPTATTAQMTIAGGTNLTYTCTLATEAGSFTGGTTASDSLDLTGGTVSGTTVHTAEADLPMTDSAPNVWNLTFSLPTVSAVSDGLIMSGTYTGSVTATVAMK